MTPLTLVLLIVPPGLTVGLAFWFGWVLRPCKRPERMR